VAIVRLTHILEIRLVRRRITLLVKESGANGSSQRQDGKVSCTTCEGEGDARTRHVEGVGRTIGLVGALVGWAVFQSRSRIVPSSTLQGRK